MSALTRDDKGFILGMLEHNVERELKEIELRIARIREYVARAVSTVYKSMEPEVRAKNRE